MSEQSEVLIMSEMHFSELVSGHDLSRCIRRTMIVVSDTQRDASLCWWWGTRVCNNPSAPSSNQSGKHRIGSFCSLLNATRKTLKKLVRRSFMNIPWNLVACLPPYAVPVNGFSQPDWHWPWPWSHVKVHVAECRVNTKETIPSHTHSSPSQLFRTYQYFPSGYCMGGSSLVVFVFFLSLNEHRKELKLGWKYKAESDKAAKVSGLLGLCAGSTIWTN